MLVEATHRPRAAPARARPRPASRSPRARRGCRSPRPGRRPPRGARASARAGPSSSSARFERLLGRAHATRSLSMRPRIPFTSRPASSDEYRFASVTASSIATSTGTSPRSSSWIPIRRTFRSSAPSRSAGQPSDASVTRRSSSSAFRRDFLGQLLRERVDLALVERGERLAGHVPLVEQEERGPASGAATRHQPVSAGKRLPASSRKLVE